MNPGREGKGVGRSERRATLPRSCCTPLHSEEVLLTSTPTLGQQPSAKTDPQLQPHRAPGSLRMRLSFKPES